MSWRSIVRLFLGSPQPVRITERRVRYMPAGGSLDELMKGVEEDARSAAEAASAKVEQELRRRGY